MKVQCIKNVTVEEKYTFTKSKTYNAQLCVNGTAIKVRYEDETKSRGILFALNNTMIESFKDKLQFENYFTIVEK